ncbi:PAS domain S-box protein [Halotia branconii]|uniref:histidine kinase n=1 Tax=Halotia branconii CENA392 TaxID=1539056 RepID=A0AAJ6NMK0_9CYAN|nr:PAS domain S-box protein [Halotia branconii]WGV23225.1 PAS domain S-box protein [Halotia branconii CENA392]
MQKDNKINESGDQLQKLASSCSLDNSQEDFSATFLLQIINGTEDPIFVKDRQHRLMLLNDAFCNFLGFKREELIGKSDYDFFPKAEADVFWEKDELVFTTGMTNENEESLTDAQGVTHFISTKKSLFQDSAGNQFLVGNIRDITQNIIQSKQIEVELRHSKQLLQLVIDNIPQLIFWKDLDSVYLGCNRKFAQVTGVDSPENIVGLRDYDLPGKKDKADWYRECDRRVMESGIPELEIIRNQQESWMNTNKIPLCNAQGDVVGILGTYEDITKRKITEEALRHSEAKLQKLSANVPGMLYQFMLHPDGSISFPYINSGSYELYGLTPEQIQANPNLIISIVHPDERQNFEQAIAASAQTLQPWQWEGRIVFPNGQIKWLQAASRPELQADGAIIWDGLIMDVTRLKQAEEALQQSYAELEKQVEARTKELAHSTEALQAEIIERLHAAADLRASQQRLALLIQQTPIGVIEWDTKFEIQEWNPAAERIFGYSKSEVLGRYLDFLVPEVAREHVKQVTVALLQQQGGTWSVNENLTKDNRTIICEWYNSPLIADNGKLISIASMVLDITELKRAETQLKEKEQFLRSVYDGSEHAIFVVDVLKDGDFCFTGWNPATERATGINRIDVIGATPESVHGAVEGAEIRKRYLSCLEADKPINYEECLTFHNQESWWLTTINPLKDSESKTYRLVGTTFNITERKQAETQLKQQKEDLERAIKELQQTQMQLVQSEKMSGLGQLVAGVAHEINNPVNFIYGNLAHADDYTQDLLEMVQLYQQYYPEPILPIQELAQDIDLEFLIEDLPQMLNSMKVGAQRIRDIVVSLRTFSRMDEAEMKEVNIHEGIDSTLMILEHRIKSTPNRCSIQIVKEYSDLPLVECYAGQLNQVFMNILANAIDALEESLLQKKLPSVDSPNNSLKSHENEQLTTNNPQIHIRTQLLTPNQVQICIADNGTGIPEAVKERLFEPFFTTKPIGKGTGMGLSISYQIICQKHGGSLKCISQLGSGTEFIINIPLRQE